MKKLYLSVVLLFLVYASFSQSRYLDKTFGNDGYAITNFGSNSFLYSIAVQADGKTVAAGTANENFAVSRYNADGSADNSFGTNGQVITDLGNSEDAKAIVVQTDGKIIVAGSTQSGTYPDIQSSIAMVRYNTDGTLDNSFGNSGKVITIVLQQTFGYAMALQTDGKIVVTGTTSNDGSNTNILLVRYNSNGTTDNLFGTAGVVTSSFDYENEAYAIALQLDGKILIAGFDYDGSSNTTNSVLVRYKQNGLIDSSFGEDGVAIDYGGVASSLAVQADGKIIVGGRGYNDDYDFYGYIQRKNADGTNDDTFGNHGTLAGGYYSGFTSDVFSVILQPDGKAVVSVTRKSSSDKTTLGIIRLTTQGKADSTFGNNGLVAVSNENLSFSYPPSNPLALNADGKILAGATFNSNFAVARLLAQNTVATATNQLKNILNIHIYPNPVISNLNVDGLDKTLPTVLIIADVSGNVIMQQKIGAGTNVINVNMLKQGRYVAVFIQNNKMGSVKFIKQ